MIDENTHQVRKSRESVDAWREEGEERQRSDGGKKVSNREVLEAQSVLDQERHRRQSAQRQKLLHHLALLYIEVTVNIHNETNIR